ncbi:DNA helicase MCM8 isoform X1 [Cephus cinctus]|uniref:DNA helicase MCM8 n=1 Tax=Cephus cinctus TaxID=211228 RepID=A0AAJ7FEL3_CEPCN|nr:DNA helicase MCM8 isoform X1 [Cephus cinctus]
MSNRGNFHNNRRYWNNKRKRSISKESDSNTNNANKNIPGNNVPLAEDSANPVNHEENAITFDLERNSEVPYCGWQLYFHAEEYKKNSSTVKKLEAIEDFLERHQILISRENFEAGIPCHIDINLLLSDIILLNNWETFDGDLRDNPRHTLNCIDLAIHQRVVKILLDDTTNSADILANLPMIRATIINYKPIIPLRYLKISSYGKLISTRGCVIRVARSKHLAQWIVFVCSKCGLQKVIKQPDGIYTVPRRCNICGVTKYKPVLDSPHTKTVLFQMIRVQEHFDDEQNDRGMMPRMLDVELTDHLVDSCMPGDDVSLTGIIKMSGTNDGKTKGNTSNALPLYMEAVAVINKKYKVQNKHTSGIEMNLTDYYAIKEVHAEPNLFKLLVHSLCPDIYGHEIIKAGLILSLFGGSGNHAEVRDDIHVLVVGDPGLGKSQMLQACARVAPKGVYICGNSSTSSGLTVTLTKENGTNDFALEPGALVLADKGCCCIDEFDKMSTQHQALLEAMEQQSVSVAKSGIICSLPARTSILAAANPIGGRYDRSKTVIQNLNMSEPLLSRFDLVFILLDRPNQVLDKFLCEHVMSLHAGLRANRNQNNSFRNSNSQPSTSQHFTLREKLSVSNGETIDNIPQSILRKYISYARQYVRPKLSSAAAEVIKTFYFELRKKSQVLGSIQVFHRQLEALIRLTEARAKLELRTEATETDALEVVEVLKATLVDVSDENTFSCLPSTTSGKITKNKVQAFISLLRNESELNKKSIFSATELKEISKNGGITIDDFTGFISKLNEEGFLLKKGINMYKLICN